MIQWLVVALALTLGAGTARAMPGDACQCGDVDDDRALAAPDADLLRGHLADPSGAPLGSGGSSKCNVAGGAGSACDVLDVAVLRRALANLDPGIADTCAAQYGASGSVVRFAAFGAQGSGNEGQLAVADALHDACLDRCCDFVQLLGDNFYDSGVVSTSDPLFASHFEIPYAPIELDFWAVLGNNDYGQGGSGFEVARAQAQVDYSNTVATKFKLPARYWHRSVEHVHFLGLDSTATFWSDDAQQRLDVDAWLDASTATWNISAGNHCYRSNGEHGNAGCYEGACFIPIVNGAAVKTFYDNLLCGRVDLALCAHDHNMQWLQTTCSGTELIVAGTGSKLSELVGTQATHFEAESLGFVLVEIDGNTLRADFIDETGVTLFTRTITKP